MKQFIKNKLGFTLIELLVVIAIIGILSGIIIVGMSNATTSATIAKAQVFSSSSRNSILGNLVSEWKMDGNIVDTWGSNNATGSGVTYPAGNCAYGTCATLSGSGSYINLGGNTLNTSLLSVFGSGQAFTYSLWFYPTTLPTGSYWYWIFCKAYSSSSSPYYQIETTLQVNGFIQSDIYNNSGNPYIPRILSTNGSISLNKWYFLVVTVDLSAGTHRMYLNGSLVNSTSGTTGTYTNHTTDVLVGANYNLRTGSTYNFIGKIDEVRLYNAVLPTSKVKEQYFAGLNNLLAKGGITKQEYTQRLAELYQSYVEK